MTELLVIDVWDDVVIRVVDLDFVMPVSHLVEVLSHVVVEALAVRIGVGVLVGVNANFLVAEMTAFELPMSIS